MPRDRTLKEQLARYMDPQAFRESVPDAVKFTCKEQGRVVHDKLKDRRQISMKRAECAIRFFLKPENREALDYRAASVDTRRMAETNEDSARGEARVARSREAGDAPDTSPSPPSSPPSSPQDQTP